MGITDPSEEYFKDGLWGYVSTSWKKLVATVGGALHIQFAGQEADVEIKQQAAADLTPGINGYIGGAWQKLPMLWGFSRIYSEVQERLTVAAGTVDMYFSAVPAGEIWVVRHFCIWPQQANASRLDLRAIVGGTNCMLASTPTVAQYKTHDLHGFIVLEEADQLHGRATGASLNDDFYAYATGYKIDIDL